MLVFPFPSVPLQRVLARVLLFWERRVVVNLAVSNLIAHRVRNRKTMVMYSLALAFIVFLTVASNQEIQVAQYNQMQANGAPILYVPPCGCFVVVVAVVVGTISVCCPPVVLRVRQD